MRAWVDLQEKAFFIRSSSQKGDASRRISKTNKLTKRLRGADKGVRRWDVRRGHDDDYCCF